MPLKASAKKSYLINGELVTAGFCPCCQVQDVLDGFKLHVNGGSPAEAGHKVKGTQQLAAKRWFSGCTAHLHGAKNERCLTLLALSRRPQDYRVEFGGLFEARATQNQGLHLSCVFSVLLNVILVSHHPHSSGDRNAEGWVGAKGNAVVIQYIR